MGNLNFVESETVEFKESLNEKQDGGESLCAFVNKNGGTLYFGVKNNGDLVGIQTISEKTIRDLSQYYYDNFEPAIVFSIEAKNIQGINIIIIKADKSSTPHHTFKGKSYIRIGPTTRPMSQEELQRRLVYYKSTNKDYSSTIIKDAKMPDLSIDAIQELRRLLMQSGRYKRDVNKLGTEQLLTDLNLLQNNKLTLACLLLLGTEKALSRLIPQAEIRYGYRLNEGEIRNQDTEIFTGGYLLYYQKLWEKIDSRNITLNIPFGMRLLDKKAFEEETIREALNNAVIHRDYTSTESSFVIQYPTKIEIKSPGGFLEGITVENIINETKTRNKLFADALYKCELVEQFGSGVNLMYQNQLSLGKSPPDFSKSNYEHVILKIDGTIQDIEFAKYVIKVAQEKQKILNDQELLLLNRIKNNHKVSASEITRNLLDLGLIENAGYGKYMLSKAYYSSSNQKGLYTRIKGLNDEEKKALILKHLHEYERGYIEDFKQLLPETSESKIYRLLKELGEAVEYQGNKKITRGKNRGFWKAK